MAMKLGKPPELPLSYATKSQIVTRCLRPNVQNWLVPIATLTHTLWAKKE